MDNELQEIFEQSLVTQYKQRVTSRNNYWIRIPHTLYNNEIIQIDGESISLLKYIGFQGFYLYCLLLCNDSQINPLQVTTLSALTEQYTTKGMVKKIEFHKALQRLCDVRLVGIDKNVNELKANTLFLYSTYNPKSNFERVKVNLVDLFVDGTYDYRALTLYCLLHRYHNTFKADMVQISKGEFGYAFPSMELIALTIGCSKSTVNNLIEDLEIVHGTKHKRLVSVHRNKKLVETASGLQRIPNKYCCYPKADPQNYFYIPQTVANTVSTH